MGYAPNPTPSSYGATENVGGPAWAKPAAFLGTLRSLSLALQSILDRIAAARLARGDNVGAERVRNIANMVGNGLQWWTGMGALSWDYVANYLSRSMSRGMDVSNALSYLSDLSWIAQEVTQLQTDGERLQWISRNYSRVFTAAKSALGNLLHVFDHDGAIRNFILVLQREVVEGDLLRDMLRLGPTDLDSIIRMSKAVLQGILSPASPSQRP